MNNANDNIVIIAIIIYITPIIFKALCLPFNRTISFTTHNNHEKGGILIDKEMEVQRG